MPLHYGILDVFTDEAFKGNPLAVVLDAGGLSTAQMQAVASELNLSETVFVCEALHPAHTASLRFFTPRRELPFAGHPTIGASAYMMAQRFKNLSEQQNVMLVLEQKIGVVRVGVTLDPKKPTYALFDIPKASEKLESSLDKSVIAMALGISPIEIGFENHIPSLYTAGTPFTFVPVRNLSTLSKAKPVVENWPAAFGYSSEGVYLYTRETERFGSAFAARMFAPSIGVKEDPATGSAVAAFSGVVMHFDALQDGDHKMVIEQGFHMERPSFIDMVLDVRSRKLCSTHIGGFSVLVAEGQFLV